MQEKFFTFKNENFHGLSKICEKLQNFLSNVTLIIYDRLKMTLNFTHQCLQSYFHQTP